MKIRTKVKAGRGCGGGTPDIQSGHATQRPHNPGTPATVRPFPSQGDDHEDQDQGQSGSRLWRYPRHLVGPRHVEITQPGHAGNGALFPRKETIMKIRTKVQAGRGCGGGSTPSIQQRRATQRPHNPGTPATVRPFSSQETIMKIKTKVKAGPRDCGGGKLPVAVDVQSDVHPAHLGAPPRSRGVQHRGASLPLSPNQETIMKIKTKVKAGPRDCGGGGSKLPVEQTV